MRNLTKFEKNISFSKDKLINYGFLEKENTFLYEEKIANHFLVRVEITNKMQISQVIDTDTLEEYSLVDVEGIEGSFVGKIKNDYENILNDIISKCTTKTIFVQKQSQELIKYVKEKYQDDLEFLWEKFSKNAIWRNKTNQKWYGILLTIPSEKLGLEKQGEIEILDIRCPQENIVKVIDNHSIFPGYHMNKNHWITILLNDSITTEEIKKYMDQSYQISLKK